MDERGFGRLKFNTLKPRQNGRHFADDTFKHILLSENIWVSIKIPLKFVPKGPINNFYVIIAVFKTNALSHLPNYRLPSFLKNICIMRSRWGVNTILVCISYIDAWNPRTSSSGDCRQQLRYFLAHCTRQGSRSRGGVLTHRGRVKHTCAGEFRYRWFR